MFHLDVAPPVDMLRPMPQPTYIPPPPPAKTRGGLPPTLTPAETLADTIVAADASGITSAVRAAIDARDADVRRVLCAHLATLRADLADAKANPERVQRAPFYAAQITILRGLGESLYPGAWVDTTDPEASR